MEMPKIKLCETVYTHKHTLTRTHHIVQGHASESGEVKTQQFAQKQQQQQQEQEQQSSEEETLSVN